MAVPMTLPPAAAYASTIRRHSSGAAPTPPCSPKVIARGTAPTHAARWRRTAGSASARTPAEGLRREAGHLLRRHVADVLVHRPAVPERVDELAGPFAPERVVQRLEL